MPCNFRRLFMSLYAMTLMKLDEAKTVPIKYYVIFEGGPLFSPQTP